MLNSEFLTIFIAETLGTTLLILFGNGVVANVVLESTKGSKSGWIVIAMAWSCGTFIPALMFNKYSGSHFNPALSLGLACAGKIKWINFPFYILGEFLGAFLGACLVFVLYFDHFKASSDKTAKLSVFCTVPAIKNIWANLITEFICTFVLVVSILMIGDYNLIPGVSTFAVAILILGIGLSLGGTTGYAINPSRDLSPRIAHSILPVPEKGPSQWNYSYVPIIGPLLGGVLAAYFYKLLKLLDPTEKNI